MDAIFLSSLIFPDISQGLPPKPSLKNWKIIPNLPDDNMILKSFSSKPPNEQQKSFIEFNAKIQCKIFIVYCYTFCGHKNFFVCLISLAHKNVLRLFHSLFPKFFIIKKTIFFSAFLFMNNTEKNKNQTKGKNLWFA